MAADVTTKDLRFRGRKVNSNIPYHNSGLVFLRDGIGSLNSYQYIKFRSPPGVLLFDVVVVSQLLPRDRGMAEDHGAPEAEPLPTA